MRIDVWNSGRHQPMVDAAESRLEEQASGLIEHEVTRMLPVQVAMGHAVER